MAETTAKANGPSPMFTPFTLRDMTVNNRVVLSPMCMYSAIDGTVNDFHLVHLGSRAMGGAGLLITEMTDVSPQGRISPGCAGMYRPEHVPAWQRVVDYVHTYSAARICVQLGHAGRKAAADPSLAAGAPEIEGDWEILAPSAIPFSPDSRVPKAMDHADIEQLRGDFVRAAQMADEAGFDMIDLHFAHGYLLSSFISPLSNHRTDEFGGSLENRMRLPLEIFHAVRAVWPDDKPISARLSCVDWVEGGTTIEDSVEISRMLREAGLDIVCASSGNVTDAPRPSVSGLFQTPFSEQIRREAGIPTMTVGNISDPADINAIIEDGRADLCVMAKGHLYDPYFTRHAAHVLDESGPPWPAQYARVGRYRPSI